MCVPIGGCELKFGTFLLCFGNDVSNDLIVGIGKEHRFGIEAHGFQIVLEDDLSMFYGVFMLFDDIGFIINGACRCHYAIEHLLVSIYNFINIIAGGIILCKNTILNKFQIPILDQAITCLA